MSSMGNGFTFPLETLVFWALAESCREIAAPSSGVRTLTYGDDIIIARDAYPLLLDVFRSVGFTLNVKKSYSDGRFRESCGADYILGSPVRPVYIDGAFTAMSLFTLHNGLLSLGFYPECEMIRSWFDETLRRYGPKGYGDGYFHRMPHEGYIDDLIPIRTNGYGGFHLEVWADKACKLEKESRNRFFRAIREEGRPRTIWDKSKIARRVATYVQYTRETRPTPSIFVHPTQKVGMLTRDGEAYSRLFVRSSSLQFLEDLGDTVESDLFVTPGTSGIHLIRIYTFGPTAP